MQLTITFIKERNFLPYLFILFQSEKIALSILCIQRKKSKYMLPYLFILFHLKRLALSIYHSIKEKKSNNIFLPYLFILFQSEKISIKHSMQLTMTFIKEKKSIIYSYLISSFSFSLKRLALSILCNWQWLPSKKEIHNIFLPYLFIFFQSEKIRIKHSMQLIITFIKEKKSIIYSYLSLHFLSVWKDSHKAFYVIDNNFHQRKEIHNIFLPYLFILFQSEKISIKHSMQLTITFIKERNPKYIPNWSLYFVSVWKD